MPDHLAAELADVRTSGRARDTFCTAHDDEHESLSIGVGREGRLLLHCQAGCEPRDVLAAAGLTMNDLFASNGSGPSPESAPSRSWPIRDAEGQEIATHHRQDLAGGEKRVWWSRNGTKGLGGLKTAELPLYGSDRLNERQPGDDTPVFVVEGEKAADALLELDLPTLGTVTGAASAPSAEALEILRHADVVLWPDNDDSGRKHMQRVAANLEGIAASVRVFTPTSLPKGGDSVEWIGACSGDAVSELLAAVEAESHDAEQPSPSHTLQQGEVASDRDMTHDGLALSLEQLWPEARYVKKWGRWLFFDGSPLCQCE